MIQRQTIELRTGKKNSTKRTRYRDESNRNETRRTPIRDSFLRSTRRFHGEVSIFLRCTPMRRDARPGRGKEEKRSRRKFFSFNGPSEPNSEKDPDRKRSHRDNRRTEVSPPRRLAKRIVPERRTRLVRRCYRE